MNLKLSTFMNNIYKSKFDPDENRSWFLIISLVIISAYVYSFLEWIFFITQPSYMSSSSSLMSKLSLLFFSGLVIGGLSGFLVIFIFLLSRIFPFHRVRSAFHFLGQLVLAFLLACLLLLLVDNFTYTIFNIGISSSVGIIRGLYAAVFLVLFYFAYHHIKPYTNQISENIYRGYRWQILLASLLIIVSLLFIFFTNLTEDRLIPVKSESSLTIKPHILLIGSDGLDAASMSVYGYERETTPNLAAFAKGALVAQNAFANANSSAPSVTSMLTGKLPSTTRVMFPPDILIDNEALEHLPAILKEQGYHNIQMAMPHYVDAYTVNIQQGFDTVNNRSVNNYPVLYAGWQIGGDYPYYFITITVNRIISRLKHILFIEQMVNPYDQVTTGVGLLESDEEYTQQLISLLETSQDPLFVHVHFLGTHGPYYNSDEKYFAKSEYQSIPSDPDFYDDAIREFDHYFGLIINKIEELDLQEKTIIIVYSDHGKDRSISRVPWMIHFPNQEYIGNIQQNVQNLDIAPTLLDYLNFPIPFWMEGDSVLNTPLSSFRRIFIASIASDRVDQDGLWDTLDTSKITPPFYQFGAIRMIVCDQFYEVNLNENKWVQGQVIDHTAPCDPTTLPTLEEAKAEIIEHLVERDFDVSSLK